MNKRIIPTRDRKTRFWPKQRNTFGLLPGLENTCPGATTGDGGCWHVQKGRRCPLCYAERLRRCYKNIHRVMAHNTRLMTRASQREMENYLTAEFDRFTAEEQIRGVQHLHYRLHWSGDIFSERYAKALANAINKHRNIKFWNYTRSFKWVKHFQGLPNLVLFLSLDEVNKEEGLRCFTANKKKLRLRLAYMGEKNALRLKPCPVDEGRLRFEYGCANCRGCWKAARPVFFKAAS